jgi:hypothetical protein
MKYSVEMDSLPGCTHRNVVENMEASAVVYGNTRRMHLERTQFSHILVHFLVCFFLRYRRPAGRRISLLKISTA